MSFDASLVNNTVFVAANTAAVNAVNTTGPGTHSGDSTEYSGSFYDYLGPFPSGNVAATTTNGNTGSFTVPEPSTYALVLVALVATTIIRLPSIRRPLGGRTA